MKKAFLFLTMFLAIIGTTQAQLLQPLRASGAYQEHLFETGTSVDSTVATNAQTKSMTLNLLSYSGNLRITLLSRKISGTKAGKITFSTSEDGANYMRMKSYSVSPVTKDSLILTNTAGVQYEFFDLGIWKSRFLKIELITTGTQVTSLKALVTAKTAP